MSSENQFDHEKNDKGFENIEELLESVLEDEGAEADGQGQAGGSVLEGGGRSAKNSSSKEETKKERKAREKQ